MRSNRRSGLVIGAKRVTRWPSAVSRNLVKFHLMRRLPKMPGAAFQLIEQRVRAGAVNVYLAEQRKLTP